MNSVPAPKSDPNEELNRYPKKNSLYYIKLSLKLSMVQQKPVAQLFKAAMQILQAAKVAVFNTLLFFIKKLVKCVIILL